MSESWRSVGLEWRVSGGGEAVRWFAEGSFVVRERGDKWEGLDDGRIGIFCNYRVQCFERSRLSQQTGLW